jgi:hypothetical protein
MVLLHKSLILLKHSLAINISILQFHAELRNRMTTYDLLIYNTKSLLK